MSSGSRTEQQAADQKLEIGIQQNLTVPIMVGGKPYTATQIAAVLQGRIDARNASDAARATYRAAVSAEAASIAGSKVLLAQVKAVLLVMYAGTPLVLAAMGLTEKKASTPSVSVKAEAIVKRTATREARHTTGPKAKLKITGVVAPVTPVATPGTGGAPHT